MSFRLRHEQRPNAFGKEPTIWIIEDDAGNRLDVWPALGFNAFRWTASGVDILDCDPTFFEIQKPTRSGFPILFPFPNRIRAGRFSYAARQYQLPLNCPTKKNAIHGFVLNEAWTPSVTVAADHAVVQGHIDLDTPLWPAPARLTIEYRLGVNSLGVNARVDAKGETLPFGLGYHPYFRVEPFGGDGAIVTVAANKIWELSESLPTGKLLSPPVDLRGGKSFGELTLDDVYTDLSPKSGWVAGMKHPSQSRRLDLFVDPDFREIVMFTPPHRRAIAIEPYTCATDAIHLPDAGRRELPAGQSWAGNVRLEYTP